MKKNVLFVGAGLFILIIFAGLRRNSAPFFSVTEYQSVQDGLLSDEYHSAINNVLSDLLKNNCAAHVIIDQLKNQFLALKKVVISYWPCATHVKITTHEPICCINDAAILIEHNEILSKNVFAIDAVEDIPNVEVAHDCMANVPVFVSSLLRELPQNIDKIYDIKLTNECCIHLVDKQQPQFTIISSVAQKKSPQLLAQCAAIKQSIDERKGFDKGVRWVADTRFAHYIVAYKA